MKAFGHCGDEPDNKQKARERLEFSQLRGNQLSCLYHASEAQSAYQRSSLALEHLESASVSLKHAKDALRIITGDAERFCSFDEARSERISQLKKLVSETITALEEHIAEHGEDGFEVP